MQAEIDARKAGESRESVTPQIGGAGAWEPIGKNADGRMLYEDQRGVRSYVEGGVRVSEPVAIRPTRDGVAVATIEHKGEWALPAETPETTSPAEEPAHEPAGTRAGSPAALDEVAARGRWRRSGRRVG